jgi:hypothetical protein
MSAPTPTDFPGADSYYTPEPGGLFFSLSPMMTATLILLLGLALLLGWLWGRSKRPTDDPSEAIYTAVKKALAEATGAPRDTVIAAARKAQAAIKAQLGDVLLLAHGLAGPYDALGPALEGVDHGHHAPEPHKPEPAEKSGIEKVIIKARDVFITTPAASDDHKGDDAHDDHGHGHGHGKDDHGKGHGGGHGHGSGHGSGKKLDTAAQIERVRAAIHNLSDHWSDKAARLAELRAARKQLTRAS